MLRDKVEEAELVLADPIHLRYLANFYVDPFSLGADFGGVLVVRPDGHATLYHDRRLPESVQAAHVDRREAKAEVTPCLGDLRDASACLLSETD